MQLTPEQQQTVRNWASAGDGLQQIQQKLASEFKLPLTYMDVRFLIIELGIQLQERKVQASAKDLGKPVENKVSGHGGEDDADELPEDAVGWEPGAPGHGGGVSVNVDRIMKPGSIVSGSVTFSDGVSAEWSLDQFGRLGLAPSKPGYKPSAEDVQGFQLELRRVLQQRGF